MVDLEKLLSMVPGMTIVLIPPTADEDWEDEPLTDEYDDGPDWREMREAQERAWELADLRAQQMGAA